MTGNGNGNGSQAADGGFTAVGRDELEVEESALSVLLVPSTK